MYITVLFSYRTDKFHTHKGCKGTALNIYYTAIHVTETYNKRVPCLASNNSPSLANATRECVYGSDPFLLDSNPLRFKERDD